MPATLQNAKDLGVTVVEKKTFLSFDEPSNNSDMNGCRRGRRFTTTDLIMNKELINALCEKLHPLTEDDESSPPSPSAASIPPLSSLQTPMVSSAALPAYPQSKFTTVMIRNVPNRYSQDELISAVNKLGFRGEYDFFYAPIDFRNKCNVGYFFINLTSTRVALKFMDVFEGLSLPAYRSSKVCSPTWARVQGFVQNVEHYRHSPVNEMHRDYRPRIFDPSIPGGIECPFPRGDYALIEARLRVDENGVVRSKHAPMPPKAKTDHTAASDRKVFVGGLGPETTECVIADYLKQFGDIEDVSIIYDSVSRTSRGFAFCTFADSQSVASCVAGRDTHVIAGRSVGIRPYSQTKNDCLSPVETKDF